MLVSVRDRNRSLIAAGRSMEEVVAADPARDFDAKRGGGYVSATFVEMVFASLRPLINKTDGGSGDMDIRYRMREIKEATPARHYYPKIHRDRVPV
jgi:hypothetical protein